MQDLIKQRIENSLWVRNVKLIRFAIYVNKLARKQWVN